MFLQKHHHQNQKKNISTPLFSNIIPTLFESMLRHVLINKQDELTPSPGWLRTSFQVHGHTKTTETGEMRRKNWHQESGPIKLVRKNVKTELKTVWRCVEDANCVFHGELWKLSALTGIRLNALRVCRKVAPPISRLVGVNISRCCNVINSYEGVEIYMGNTTDTTI